MSFILILVLWGASTQPSLTDPYDDPTALPHPPFSTRARADQYYPHLTSKPSFKPGQRFVYMPTNTQASPFRDLAGAVVDWDQLRLSLLTLRSLDTGKATFEVEGRADLIRMPFDGTHLHGLRFVLPDSQADAINQRVAGQAVWAYNKLWAYIGPADGQQPVLSKRWFDPYFGGYTKPFVVKRVLRIHPWQYDTAIGAEGGQPMEGLPVTYTDHDPLLIVYSTVNQDNWHATYPSSAIPRHDETPRPHVDVPGYAWSLVADNWDFERTFSLRPPPLHDWPPTLKSDIEQGHLKAGMTHTMVAWALGYPSNFGTPQTLDHAPLWEYDSYVPSTTRVLFRHDKVVRINNTDLP